MNSFFDYTIGFEIVVCRNRLSHKFAINCATASCSIFWKVVGIKLLDSKCSDVVLRGKIQPSLSIDIDTIEIAVAHLVIARSEFLAPFKAVIKCFWVS